MNKANHFPSVKYSMNPIENVRIRNVDKKHQCLQNPSSTSPKNAKGFFLVIKKSYFIVIFCSFYRESSVSKQD